MFTTIITIAGTYDIGLHEDEVYDVKAVANDTLCFLHINGVKCWKKGQGFINSSVYGFEFTSRGTKILFGEPKNGFVVRYPELDKEIVYADAEAFSMEPFSKFGYIEFDDERLYVNHVKYGKRRIRHKTNYEDVVIGDEFIAFRRGDEWYVKSLNLKRVATMHFLEAENHDVQIGDHGYAVMFSSEAMKLRKALIFRLTNTGLLALGQIILHGFAINRKTKKRSVFISGGYLVYHIDGGNGTLWSIVEIEPRGVWA